jgi:probable addiction module antidote protein
MTSKTRPYRESLPASLSDPEEAAHYLNAAIEDSPASFLKALRNVAQARQMAKVAKNAGLTRESLYKALSEDGNPTFDTLHSVLGVLGIKMSFGVEQREI